MFEVPTVNKSTQRSKNLNWVIRVGLRREKMFSESVTKTGVLNFHTKNFS